MAYMQYCYCSTWTPYDLGVLLTKNKDTRLWVLLTRNTYDSSQSVIIKE